MLASLQQSVLRVSQGDRRVNMSHASIDAADNVNSEQQTEGKQVYDVDASEQDLQSGVCIGQCFAGQDLL